jgi:hypothetical protein
LPEEKPRRIICAARTQIVRYLMPVDALKVVLLASGPRYRESTVEKD